MSRVHSSAAYRSRGLLHYVTRKDFDEEIQAATSISKKDMLRFILNELADVKYAYLHDN